MQVYLVFFKGLLSPLGFLILDLDVGRHEVDGVHIFRLGGDNWLRDAS